MVFVEVSHCGVVEVSRCGVVEVSRGGVCGGESLWWCLWR